MKRTANWVQVSQLPNEYVLHYASRLSGVEFKFLIVAVQKIGGYPEKRYTMEDNIALSEFMRLAGVSDKHTAIRSLDRLVKLGLLRRVGAPTQRGQRWRIVRHMDFAGQQDLFRGEFSGVETTPPAVWKPHHSGVETTPTKQTSNKHSNRTYVAERTNERVGKSAEAKPKTVDEISTHLKQLEENGNGYADAARLTLSALRQFWDWGHKDEALHSWEWLLHAAHMAAPQFERALGDTRARQVARNDLRKPAAYFTRLVRTYAREDAIPL